ncbi:hypothetical protein ECSTECMHI813_0924 [Escherichia coli STEC_MHI813]|nr:hypothetical protein ECSTECMHI813_0924 [Escherichia coli STEC_MHI813]
MPGLQIQCRGCNGCSRAQFAVRLFRVWLASTGTVQLNSSAGGLSVDFVPKAPCD